MDHNPNLFETNEPQLQLQIAYLVQYKAHESMDCNPIQLEGTKGPWL